MTSSTEFIYKNVSLRYNPETGECWRKFKGGNWALITPGTHTAGYTRIKIGGTYIRLHRILAEVFLNGGIPLTGIQQVDHIIPVDGSHAQDKIGNLRIVSNCQNSMNRGGSSRSTSGYKGVYWDKQANKWKAEIVSYSRRRHLGFFTTPEAAAKAYDQAAKLLNGEFAKLNFV